MMNVGTLPHNFSKPSGKIMETEKKVFIRCQGRLNLEKNYAYYMFFIIIITCWYMLTELNDYVTLN